MNKIKITVICIFFLLSCAKTDPVTGEKILIETDARKKSENFAKEGGGIFGNINKNSKSTTFEFSTSNVLWRATLQTLDFLPLVNADYSGGVIIYDWYSDKLGSNEQIKITVRFLDNELRAESVQINSQKKICDKINLSNCYIAKGESIFENFIKDEIINAARLLKLKQSKEKN